MTDFDGRKPNIQPPPLRHDRPKPSQSEPPALPEPAPTAAMMGSLAPTSRPAFDEDEEPEGNAENTATGVAPGAPMVPRGGRGERHKSLPLPYVAAWLICAAISLMYLSTAIIAPDVLGMTDGRSIAANGNGAPATTGALSSKPRDSDLDQRLTKARMEIAKLRTELTMRDEADQPGSTPAVTAAPPEAKTPQVAKSTSPAATERLPPVKRVTTLNVLNAPETGGNETAQTDTAAAARMAAAAKAEASENAKAEAEIATAALKSQTLKPAAAPIETGSIRVPPAPGRRPAPPSDVVAKIKAKAAALAKAAEAKAQAEKAAAVARAAAKPARVAFAAPQVTRAPTAPVTSAPKLGLRLARGPSVDAIRLSWNLMRERHPDVLGSLTPRYVFVPATPTTAPAFQLLAGPLNGAAEALQTCQDMSARGLPCEIGDFAGNAL